MSVFLIEWYMMLRQLLQTILNKFSVSYPPLGHIHLHAGGQSISIIPLSFFKPLIMWLEPQQKNVFSLWFYIARITQMSLHADLLAHWHVSWQLSYPSLNKMQNNGTLRAVSNQKQVVDEKSSRKFIWSAWLTHMHQCYNSVTFSSTYYMDSSVRN